MSKIEIKRLTPKDQQQSPLGQRDVEENKAFDLLTLTHPDFVREQRQAFQDAFTNTFAAQILYKKDNPDENAAQLRMAGRYGVVCKMNKGSLLDGYIVIPHFFFLESEKREQLKTFLETHQSNPVPAISIVAAELLRQLPLHLAQLNLRLMRESVRVPKHTIPTDRKPEHLSQLELIQGLDPLRIALERLHTEGALELWSLKKDPDEADKPLLIGVKDERSAIVVGPLKKGFVLHQSERIPYITGVIEAAQLEAKKNIDALPPAVRDYDKSLPLYDALLHFLRYYKM